MVGFGLVGAMKLLLIGNGYLGKAVARIFREGGWEVSPVSLSGGEGSISCDVGDSEAVAQLPAADFIVHCAASGIAATARRGGQAWRSAFRFGPRGANLPS